MLHAGYDGWREARDIPMERIDSGTWRALLGETDGHAALDCVVRQGAEYDNNLGMNYRLWIHLDPVDSHVHARVRKTPESMSFDALRTAFYSSGMTHALISWRNNTFVDRVAAGIPWLSRLVWVRPGRTREDEVRRRLADGTVGLKLHPAYDGFEADSSLLDPYLLAAGEAGAPVAVHSSPGLADPERTAALARRFPGVPVLLYRTYLGPDEGRLRAAYHAQDVPNLYLETSWCRSSVVEQLIELVGADRVLFGSDAATDGPAHYTRTPPNIEMTETYNDALVTLADRLGPETTRLLVEDNTRRLFHLAPPTDDSSSSG